MKPLLLEDIQTYIDENIGGFYLQNTDVITKLTFDDLISNIPRLSQIINSTCASKIVKQSLEIFLSASEEKLLEVFLKGLAVFVADKTMDEYQSNDPGIDLEFETNGIYYLVAIPTHANWGRLDQQARLAMDFENAEKRLGLSTYSKRLRKVLGFCYGNAPTTLDAGYIRVEGQNFWALISGNENLYLEIIKTIAHQSKKYDGVYLFERDKKINLLTHKFIQEFCDSTGLIDWSKVLKANSGNYDLDQFFGNSPN